MAQGTRDVCIKAAIKEVPQISMDEEIHVIPEFGREHECSPCCWCDPERDVEEPLVLIHHPEQ
ncbi:hypothetical protein BH20PSE1_BH20PSE1_01220 [soil metagenome]